MTIIRWLRLPSLPVATSGSVVAAKAIASSDSLLERMREHSKSNDVARALMADIWAQRHNVPFMTTLYESAEEMKVAGTLNDQQQRHA